MGGEVYDMPQEDPVQQSAWLDALREHGRLARLEIERFNAKVNARVQTVCAAIERLKAGG